MNLTELNAVRFKEGIDFVAITGGPCGGKDTIMARARQRLESFGLNVRVMRETATDLIGGGFSPIPSDWAHDPIAFQRHVFLHQLEKEQRFLSMVEDQRLGGRTVILANRGAHEGLAYCDYVAFSNMLWGLNLRLQDIMLRYKGAIHMVTAADGAEEFYTTANNEARRETPQQAREQDILTQRAWWGHPHFHVIDNHAPGGFDSKCHRALVALARTLSMPEPLEKEHKFVLRSFNLSMLPRDAVRIGIVQTYLYTTRKCARRIRKCSRHGTDTYFYTEKEDTGVPGVRIEREREITKTEYVRLFAERDPGLSKIIKVRHSFTHANRHFELDEYHEPIKKFFVLEVEVSDLSEKIEVPAEWGAQNVTADDRYSNWSIAAGKLPAHERC